MAKHPQKMTATRKKPTSKSSQRDFFTVPEKKSQQSVTADFRMRLGGVPLETKAGFELISYRLRSLLRPSTKNWQEIDREEHGSFWSLFRKYHLPLLFPLFVAFTLREIFHFVKWALFLRHTLILFPAGVALYAAYIFLLSLIAEETAEFSGARFSPQAGMRIAMFSSLILSFLSVAFFLPVIGKPLILFGLLAHYQQLFAGARVVLNISDKHYKIYRLSHILVWLFLGLTGFLILSVFSFLAAKMGFGKI